ncbi:carbohydrate ABC transporter substrate-binding protein [Egibacter rhizosphaerae]|uniref:Probable sugar-binding periplasmic protein n=1 Tax=Egibacter rhizosphaerae TaxID=1670831 RepID=A0A411YK49_9ACTN|nr:ABC transporter substrate-binding protein [Egibacter rhizosphaerae]QBI21563.1 carbohydrate ABC transporter substrate-binding protein [Egibacter rhizosphaerae]
MRYLRFALLIGLVAVLIAACGEADDDPIADLEDEDDVAEDPDDDPDDPEDPDDPDDDEDDAAPDDVDPEDPDTIPEDAVEIFSWWTGAGEEAGLLALIEMFEEQHPEYEVVNSAVAGGAGVDAQAVLTSRMQAGDPPSTFQIHAGRALLDQWVEVDAMQPLNFLYDEEGWWDVFPDTLLEMTTDEDGNIYSVPVNVHRSNVMWTNPEVFEEAGVEVPTDFDEFFSAAEAIEEAGYTPLALGDNETWTLLHTWETVLLATAGPDMYNDLFAGDADWTSDEVVESFEVLGEMFEYVNDDHAARNWQEASQLLAEGDAAMNIMGDWAGGYFWVDLELELEDEFGWAPTPGTDGNFITVVDTFGLPEDAPNEEGVVDWLRILGSQEGQDTFNPLKGSIPARLDADEGEYNAYGQDTMDDFQSDELVPSVAHNSAAPPDFTDDALGVLEVFMSERDPEVAVQDLEAAAESFLR